MNTKFYGLDDRNDRMMIKDEFDGVEFRMISEKDDLVVYKKFSYEEAKKYRDFLDNLLKSKGL